MAGSVVDGVYLEPSDPTPRPTPELAKAVSCVANLPPSRADDVFYWVLRFPLLRRLVFQKTGVRLTLPYSESRRTVPFLTESQHDAITILSGMEPSVRWELWNAPQPGISKPDAYINSLLLSQNTTVCHCRW